MSARWWRRRLDDRGSIAPIVPLVILALLMLGGLVVDGSRDLNARGEAQAYADEAARAGATAIDLQSAGLQLDFATARQRVDDYCSAVLHSPGTPVTACSLDPDHPFTDATTCGNVTARIVVNTVVRTRVSTSLLGIVGFTELTATATSKARPYIGITRADAC